ncbi:AI-2E family transporter [Thiohalobacter sp. IOR34]|uniref:AI-2E family transporter n=1 Tax=Thiohalobacter sp. IOR34 TaxID=3057176 RepID=UPI0025AEEF12|nr:AI-2E family transporter [Thiohalobacter sp. IOR34]WJW76065.1 AI-2E family transporter [Thiohalobacter sp. IOR34]
MTTSQQWLWLAGLLLAGWLVYLLAPVLAPFLTAALFAYLGDPVADRLERYMPRALAVSLVFISMLLVVLGLLLFLIPALENQVTTFVHRLPDYIDWLQQRLLPGLGAWLGLEPDQLLDTVRLKQALAAYWTQAGGLAATLMRAVSTSGMALAGWLANLVLIPVVSFYLLRDWDRMLEHIRAMLPRHLEPQLVRLAREVDEVLGAFLRGQFMVMLALGCVYATGLWLVGLDLALFFGMLAGMVSFVPYLGFIIGILAAGGAALVQFHEFAPVLGVLAVFGVGQLLESFLLTPWLVGDRIGLHPVAVIFAVLAGGQLFGFVGVLLGLPVAAAIMVLLRHLHRHYLASDLYAPRGDGTP